LDLRRLSRDEGTNKLGKEAECREPRNGIAARISDNAARRVKHQTKFDGGNTSAYKRRRMLSPRIKSED
jgi:hypothetical protein